MLKMWLHAASSRRQQSSKAGGTEENPDKEKKRVLKLKNPAKIWKNLKQQNLAQSPEDELDGNVLQEQGAKQRGESLEEVSRRLIMKEEQLFSQDSISEEEEDQLHRDLEALTLQMWTAVHNTFPSSDAPSSGDMEVLKSTVLSIQLQEEQDRRWAGCAEDRVPVWRPQKCLSTHNRLLQSMVESRLMKAAEEESGGADSLSSPLKREVCHVGRRVKEDLLTVARAVVNCYPPQMDIMNLYAGLYHQGFSAQLNKLTASGLETEDCCYLLFWTNHCYPHEILKHEDLEGKIKTACLGALLQPSHLDQLEDQYLNQKQDKVKLWLFTALKKEEERWLSGKTPELIDQYCFSPLAVDIIQMLDGALNELSCVVRDQVKAQRLTVLFEGFLSSYKKSVEDFVKGNHKNVRLVMKAQLVCEQQFRAYILGQTGSLWDQQRQSCVDTLSALRDCGYKCLICPKQQLKGSSSDGLVKHFQYGTVHLACQDCLSSLWTAAWMDGSLPVVDSLLDSLNEQLGDLKDLKPSCREALLAVLHEDVVRQYVKRTMKTKIKSREQQVGGAQRMTDDAQKISEFFREGGCTESQWLGELLCSLAEILRLQDPGSVQLEMVSLARRFPDLSDAHVTALLSPKTGLSAADIRSIRRSVEENRLCDVSANQSPSFFSKVKVKWINSKMTQMGLKN